MDGEKRKREENGEMNGRRTEKQTVTEDEVEEFYAILRRIHVAVKYFEKGTNDKEGRRKLTDTRWWPRFEAEDFDERNSVNDDSNGGQKGEGLELDLNSDPASS